MTSKNLPHVCVVGASNTDLISYVPRLPVVGETLHGTKFSVGFGGKGANQAVMAAKMGVARVSMVTRLGTDSFGRDTRENFEAQGIAMEHVLMTEGQATGVAPIMVDSQGRNSIVIVTGANDLLSPEDIRNATETIAKSQVLVCQLESPIETTIEALRIARQHGVVTFLNPAPARTSLPAELLELSDIVSPNEPEAEMLGGAETPSGTSGPDFVAHFGTIATSLLRKGPAAALITLGEHGSLLVSETNADRTLHQAKIAPGPVGQGVHDTTGAGDCFVGTFCGLLARELFNRQQGTAKTAREILLSDLLPEENMATLSRCARDACISASLSVQRPGTQSSYPSRAELVQAGVEL